MKGFELAAEPGAPAWHELHAKDYPTAVKFTTDVFGWDTDVMSDTPDFRYTTLGAGDAAKAGIMTPPAIFPRTRPSNWQVYFAVQDADATAGRPWSWVRQCFRRPKTRRSDGSRTLSDPTGALFKIVAETPGRVPAPRTAKHGHFLNPLEKLL